MRFIDSNVFIYHLADDPEYGERASEILQKVESGSESAVTSTLVIAQVCSYLRWKKYQRVIPGFIAMLRSMPTLSKIETTFQDIIYATKLTRKAGGSLKKWDDLVIVAQMKRLGINEIYSNDKDFDELGVKRLF